MPIDLPYAFDTRHEVRLLLKLGLALLAVMTFGALHLLLVRHDLAGAAGLLLVDVALLVFGRILLRFEPGAEGRITRDAVETQARRVWGVTLPGPTGTFALSDFEAVRVERVLSSGNRSSMLRRLERVTLVGRGGTPDVRVHAARTEGDASPGEALASLLGLPCEIAREPRRFVLRGPQRPARGDE
jgi:hypothetical protein